REHRDADVNRRYVVARLSYENDMAEPSIRLNELGNDSPEYGEGEADLTRRDNGRSGSGQPARQHCVPVAGSADSCEVEDSCRGHPNGSLADAKYREECYD